MNRIVLGSLAGVLLGAIDVSMTLAGNHQEVSPTMLAQAFSSRFAIGLLAATVSLPLHPIVTGALVGLPISLPDAFCLHAYEGILGAGLLFGGAVGFAPEKWAAR